MLGFEQYFYIPFAFSKMDQFAFFDLASVSLGSWGIISYPERYLLFNSLDGTLRDQKNVIETIANRFTHQFLPSIEWWNYLWINEGLATDRSFYIDTFLADTFQPAMEFDSEPGVRSMSTYVENPDSVLNLFDSTTSSKGQ